MEDEELKLGNRKDELNGQIDKLREELATGNGTAICVEAEMMECRISPLLDTPSIWFMLHHKKHTIWFM